MSGLPQWVNPQVPPHSLYEGIEYKEFWDGLQKRNLDELEHAIVRSLLPNSGRRIIDVGCGYGRLADCYIGRFQQVIMVDGSTSLLRQAVENTGGQAMYIACDVMNLPFRAASFDAVLMVRVFHHIRDSWACLSELHRLLCDQGRFVFSYRNKRNALRVIQWLIGASKENPFTKEAANEGSTLISHHPRAVYQMLCESGFSNIRYSGVGVLDWLESKIGFVGRSIKLEERLAPFFGKNKIAPWILCSAIGRGRTRLIDVERTSDLLQCPSCGGSISDDKQAYQCLVCQKRYPIKDGIIDMRVQ
jgi:ubiquinone/menaquinone biosynthesis C-methylase UbiE